MQVGLQKTRMGETYVAETVANISGRVKEALGNVILIAYGNVVNEMCCGSPEKTDTITFTSFDNDGLGNGYLHGGALAAPRQHADMRSYEDRKRAEERGLFPEGEQESRFMRFYDSITGMNVEVGIPYRRFAQVEDNMRAITGSEEISFRKTFMGIFASDMIKHSVLVHSGAGNVLVPSEPHQLYLLHMLWSTEAYGTHDGSTADALTGFYRHHYGSMELLRNERYRHFGIGGGKYSERIQSDISDILRTHG